MSAGSEVRRAVLLLSGGLDSYTAGAIVRQEGYELHALTILSVPGGMLAVPGRRGGIGSRRRLRIRASDVSFARTRPVDSTILNCLPACILSVSRQNGDDSQVNVVARLGEDGAGARIVGRVTRKSQEALALAPGVTIFAQIKSVALVASPVGRVVP